VTSGIYSFTVDTPDPYTLATWWSQVLGHPLDEEDNPGDPLAAVILPVGPPLLFVQTDDQKVVKNRLHLDLQPDGPREAEVERLLGIGATMVDDRRNDDGTGWAVLADPEGNEFCVLRSAAERAATTPS
jgi:predicted enzyme related to lactoylglutathione lyase